MTMSSQYVAPNYLTWNEDGFFCDSKGRKYTLEANYWVRKGAIFKVEYFRRCLWCQNVMDSSSFTNNQWKRSNSVCLNCQSDGRNHNSINNINHTGGSGNDTEYTNNGRYLVKKYQVEDSPRYAVCTQCNLAKRVSLFSKNQWKKKSYHKCLECQNNSGTDANTTNH